MLGRALFGLPTLIVGIAIAGAAAACSCVGWKTAAEQFAQVDVAFIGTVEGQSTGAGAYGDAVHTRFAVTKTLKGEHLPVRTVGHSRDDGGNCGINFEPGQTVLVFAHRSDRGLGTSSCSAPQFPLADFERLAAGRK